MPLSWPIKDPDEKLDYDLDWTERLATDTITTSTWIVPVGLVSEEETFTATSTVIWLTGGTLGASYDILNRIETVGGRIMDQTVTLEIDSK